MEVQILKSEEDSDFFGLEVLIHENWIFVAAKGTNQFSGRVYAYAPGNSGFWDLFDILEPDLLVYILSILFLFCFFSFLFDSVINLDSKH